MIGKDNIIAAAVGGTFLLGAVGYVYYARSNDHAAERRMNTAHAVRSIDEFDLQAAKRRNDPAAVAELEKRVEKSRARYDELLDTSIERAAEADAVNDAGARAASGESKEQIEGAIDVNAALARINKK